MIRGGLTHPIILKALASAGHGSQVLVADGNYAFSTNANLAAPRVYLNLAPDKVKVTDVLGALVPVIPVERVDVMATGTDEEPSIWADFRALLPDLPLEGNERFAFYEKALAPSVCLVVATGETRIYANILLTIGFIPPQ